MHMPFEKYKRTYILSQFQNEVFKNNKFVCNECIEDVYILL